jgi:hypothetical protein
MSITPGLSRLLAKDGRQAQVVQLKSEGEC